jgi:hypothetical protein
MSACQVIKANQRPCRNYARRGKTCCSSHRAFENKETEEIVEEFVNDFFKKVLENQKYSQMEWPSVLEARRWVNKQRSLYDALDVLTKSTYFWANTTNLYEKRLCLLKGAELIFKFGSSNDEILKRLKVAVIDKLSNPLHNTFHLVQYIEDLKNC